MIPVFLGSDTMSDVTSPDGAEWTIERRCRLAVEAPYLLRKVSRSLESVCRNIKINNSELEWRRPSHTMEFCVLLQNLFESHFLSFSWIHILG